MTFNDMGVNNIIESKSSDLKVNICDLETLLPRPTSFFLNILYFFLLFTSSFPAHLIVSAVKVLLPLGQPLLQECGVSSAASASSSPSPSPEPAVPAGHHHGPGHLRVLRAQLLLLLPLDVDLVLLGHLRGGGGRLLLVRLRPRRRRRRHLSGLALHPWQIRAEGGWRGDGGGSRSSHVAAKRHPRRKTLMVSSSYLASPREKSLLAQTFSPGLSE